MDNNILDSFINGVVDNNFNVYGVVVRQHGKIAAEHNFRENVFVQMYSASKTFTAVGIMKAVEENIISLDDKVIDYFTKEELPDVISENLNKLTIYHLLTMTTGHKVGTVDVFYYKPCENWIKMFFDAPLVYEPGTHFEYNNGATYMLSVIIQRKTGMMLKDYLMPRVFEPLEIFNPQWDVSPWGYNKGYIGLHLTTGQLSAMGQMLLNGGTYNGKKILQKQSVEIMTKKHINNKGYWDDSETGNGYGFQLWMNSIPGTYRLDGLFGQFCIVAPQKDAVITTTCHQEKNQNDIIRLIWDTIYKEI